MDALIGLGVILVIGAILAIRERKVTTWRVADPAPESIQRVFEGRPDYERAHREELAVIEAANLAGARQSGRQLGAPVVVDWHPSKCGEYTNTVVVDWLKKHGPCNQVFLREWKN